MKIREAEILDHFLKQFYDSRNEVSEIEFDYLVVTLTGSYDNAELYKNKFKSDGYVELTASEYHDKIKIHFGHITKRGIAFYESGGYVGQLKQELHLQVQELELRHREINAAEQSAKSADESAKSAKEGNAIAKESNQIAVQSKKNSKIANYIASFSFFLTLITFCVQNQQSHEQNNDILSLRDSIATATLKLDVLGRQFKEEKNSQLRLKYQLDSLYKIITFLPDRDEKIKIKAKN